MNAQTTTPATDLINELNRLQTKYTELAAIEATLKDILVCQQCQQPLRHYKQFSSQIGECDDPNCRRYKITLELETLAALSEAQVDSYLVGRTG